MMLRMKYLWMSVIIGPMVALLATSCSESSNFSSPDIDAPKMLTFGFYVEDNADVLSKDYAVDLTAVQTSGSSTVSIHVPMPATVDKSSLVARFTMSDGTTAKVNGVEQVSRQTANDFTVPVDYILTKDNVNVRCAVDIVKATNLKWREMPVFDALTVYGDPVMKVNPKDNLPYVAFKIRTDNDYRSSVIKYENGAWVHVGDAGFGSKISSSYFDFSIAPDGTPYIAYSNSEIKATTTTLAGAMTVMKYDGSAWNYVGNENGILKAQSNYIGLAALENELVAAQQNNSAKADYPRRSMVLSTYKDGQWTSANHASVTNEIFTLSMANNNTSAYVLSINRGSVSGVNYGYNVLKYENGEWTPMLVNAIEPDATANSPYICGCAVSADNVPYIWFGDNAGGSYNIRVKTYNAETNQWKTLTGNVLPLGFAFDSHTEVAIAIGADGMPYLVYNNKTDQNYPYFMYLDAETGQWTTPVRVAEVAASGLNIAFSHTGVCYVTFADGDNHIRTYSYE